MSGGVQLVEDVQIRDFAVWPLGSSWWTAEQGLVKITSGERRLTVFVDLDSLRALIFGRRRERRRALREFIKSFERDALRAWEGWPDEWPESKEES